MEQKIKTISNKLLEIRMLIFLKNKELINENDFLKIKKDIENDYFITNRLDNCF